MTAWNWNAQMEMERQTIIAWQTAVWSRVKRIPPLDSVLKKLRKASEPKKKVDPNEARRIGDLAMKRLKELGKEHLLK